MKTYIPKLVSIVAALMMTVSSAACNPHIESAFSGDTGPRQEIACEYNNPTITKELEGLHYDVNIPPSVLGKQAISREPLCYFYVIRDPSGNIVSAMYGSKEDPEGRSFITIRDPLAPTQTATPSSTNTPYPLFDTENIMACGYLKKGYNITDLFNTEDIAGGNVLIWSEIEKRFEPAITDPNNPDYNWRSGALVGTYGQCPLNPDGLLPVLETP